MQELTLFFFLGLTAGAAYALVGQGLVLIHQGSGVVNLAQGALVMLAAYQYDSFTERGWSVGVAALATVILSAGLGGLLYLLVMRPLRDAPVLAKVVATLGLLLCATSGVGIIYGTSPRRAPTLVPTEPIDLLGVTFGRDRLYLTGIVICIAVLLAAASRWTAAGWLLRGSSESEEGVTLLGYSLQLVAAATWVLGSALAALGGILIAPATTVDVSPLTFVVIPALACALLARFSSFLVVTAAGFAVGVLQSIIPNYWDQTGVKEALPFAIIAGAMIARGRLIPDRSTIREGRPPVATPANLRLPALGAYAGAVLLGLAFMNGGFKAAIVTSMITAILALSVVVVTGYGGQVSLAQMSFAGVGALMTSKLAAGWGLPFPLAVVGASAITVALGIVVGLPALRIRGTNLAIVTLGAAVAIGSLVFKNTDYTGGFDGSSVPDPTIFGWSLNAVRYPFRFGAMVLCVLIASVVAVARLRRSTLGLRMLAVRDNERAAAAQGVSLTRTKLTAFCVSSLLAGVGGSLYAYQMGQVSFERFMPLASVQLLAAAYIAGVGSVAGALLAGLTASGGFVFQFFNGIDQISRYQALISGATLLLVTIMRPDGIAPHWQRQGEALARFFGRAPREKQRVDRNSFESAASGLEALSPAPTADRGGSNILELESVSVRFGGVHALRDVSLAIPRGHFVGLIGPNGAGKTTLIDAICGYVPARGHVRFNGPNIDNLAAHERARRGLRRTFQTVELFEDLTVQENLLVGSGDTNNAAALGLASLQAVGLTSVLDSRPSELSNGERKLVGVARALASRPKLLLLDEPAAGLDSHESWRLGERLVGLLDLGVTIVLVDHDLELVLRTCQTVIVLDQGSVIECGTPQEIRDSPAVRAAYIGDQHAAEQVGAAMSDNGIGGSLR